MNTLASLFQILRDFVIAVGGDGGACVLSEHYRLLADKFQADEHGQADPWFTERYECGRAISFANDMEAIVFADPAAPPQFCDFIVKIVGPVPGEKQPLGGEPEMPK